MRPIGFSTGALAFDDFRRGLDLSFSVAGPRVVELSALRDHSLIALMSALDTLGMETFEYVSIHAPSKCQKLTEAEIVTALRPCVPRGIPVVVHPDAIVDSDLWQSFGSLLCIENMDKRKPTGRTADEMSHFFDMFPDATFCLDLAHARQVDTTMGEARQMLRRFGDRLRQVHVSEIDAAGKHHPISLASKLSFERIAALIPEQIPVVIESVVSEADMVREIVMVKQALTPSTEKRGRSMNVVYAGQEAPDGIQKSVFLAGPTPRDSQTPSWRPDALRILASMPDTVDLTVYVPEPEDGNWLANYDGQKAWEEKHLRSADAILFYVPRDMKSMPALTTNVEWGKFYTSGRAYLAFPEGAPHMRYLAADANDEAVPVFRGDDSLPRALHTIVVTLGDGAARSGGERDVPLSIWNLSSFQAWLATQKSAGNRLDGARVLWTFRVPPLSKTMTFAWAIHVDVHIAAENRNKVNEFVLGRPDVSVIVAYSSHKPARHCYKVGCAECDANADRATKATSIYDLLETEIAIVREFRSPATTPDGFVREIPGGSSHKPGESPTRVAAEELHEETGLSISQTRFRLIGSRQVAGTWSCHKAHVFAVALTAEEMSRLKADAGTVHGVEADSERTYVEVYTLGELLARPLTDWSNLGMIAQALLQETL